MEKERFEEVRKNVLESLRNVLIEKNKRYGNAALEPLNIFYSGMATSSICIRLDDKISRVRNSEVLRKNDMFDLLGYGVLLCLAENYFDTPEETDFESRVNHVIEQLNEEAEYCGFGKTVFQKTSYVLYNLDKAIENIQINTLSDGELRRDHVVNFITNIVYYFIEEEIDNFEDLQD